MSDNITIGLYKAKILSKLGAGIYKIALLYPKGILQQKVTAFHKMKAEKPENIASLRKSLERIGSQLELDKAVLLNLRLIFQADHYFTNGHEVITVIEKDNGLSLLYRHSYKGFSTFLKQSVLFSTTSLTQSGPIDVISDLKRDIEVVKILSRQAVQIIPIVEDDQHYATIRHVFGGQIAFRYLDQVYREEPDHYYGKSVDKILNKFIDMIKPKSLKCCLNCQHFRFSGMSHDMSGGRTGYCNHLLKNENNRQGVKDRITDIYLWCDQFSKK